MTVTDELLANNEAYARDFCGPLPVPPAKHVAVVAGMDARLDVNRVLGLSIARIKAGPFVPHKDSIRGFVFDVATGSLVEVK